MAPISTPVNARLPPTLRVESTNPSAIKSLSRLSRDALISLVLDWLDDAAIQNAIPYLIDPEYEDEDEVDVYAPCRSVDELRQMYTEMRQLKGSKREILERIVEGDWRHGLTLYQLAMADFAYFDEHPSVHRWTAYQILPLESPTQDMDGDEDMLKVDKKSLKIPRFHPSTFLQNLQAQVLPDVKAHYHLHRPQGFPVLLLRILIIDSPYNTDLSMVHVDRAGGATNFNTSRVIYLAFPDGSPSLYITKPQAIGQSAAGESKSLHSLIVKGVPKALSRPQERFTLKASTLVSKNLDALLEKRGPGRSNSAGGGWSIYANEKDKASPLDSILPTPPLSDDSERKASGKKKALLNEAQKERKNARIQAKARFGSSALVTDGKGVERVEVVVQDAFPMQGLADIQDDADDEAALHQRNIKGRKSNIDALLREVNEDDETIQPGHEQWTPSVQVSFRGSHVFAGVRQLVEAGIIDGKRMPGWMTGEDGVTSGVVRNGRIFGHKGSGI